MPRFIIEDRFWELFPDARIGVALCSGLDNSRRDDPAYEALLREGERKAARFIELEPLSENPAVKAWRLAYQRFKTKGGARSSIEALLNRVKKGSGLGTINPLVDIYNYVSLSHGLPCGGEDLAAFVGDLRLTLAEGDESFITLGSEESAPPYPGEVVYKDEAGAVCRCWNWRESVRTMLTEGTRDAFLCMELPDAGRLAELEAALSELAKLVRERLGGSCGIYVLSKDRSELSLG